MRHNGGPGLPGAHPPADTPGEGLDEGLVEGWTLRKLDLVAYQIGMDRDVPGVIGAKTKSAYPASAAATRSLMDGVAQMTGVDSAQLADDLMLTDLSQRWNVIADRVIDRHLDERMPEADRPVIRADLANRLRASFARARGVDDRDELNDEAKSQQGYHVGQGAVCELGAEVCRLQDGYRNRRQLMDRSVRSDRAGGPGPASRMRSGPVRVDIEHLRRMVAGVAPAAQAPGVDQGRTSRVAYRRPAVGRAASRLRS